MRRQMPDYGTPDPYGNNVTPETSNQHVEAVASQLDSARTHKIKRYNDMVINYAMDQPVQEGCYRIDDQPP